MPTPKTKVLKNDYAGRAVIKRPAHDTKPDRSSYNNSISGITPPSSFGYVAGGLVAGGVLALTAKHFRASDMLQTPNDAHQSNLQPQKLKSLPITRIPYDVAVTRLYKYTGINGHNKYLLLIGKIRAAVEQEISKIKTWVTDDCSLLSFTSKLQDALLVYQLYSEEKNEGNQKCLRAMGENVETFFDRAKKIVEKTDATQLQKRMDSKRQRYQVYMSSLENARNKTQKTMSQPPELSEAAPSGFKSKNKYFPPLSKNEDPVKITYTFKNNTDYFKKDGTPSGLPALALKRTDKLGDVYYADVDEKKPLQKISEPLDKKLPPSVTNLLFAIQRAVQKFESYYYAPDKYLTSETFTSADIVTKCVSVLRYRRGNGYLFLQISTLGGGNARIVGYASDTRFHNASSFGTTPDANLIYANKRLYLADSINVKADIQSLQEASKSVKTVEDLYKTLEGTTTYYDNTMH